MRKRHEITIVFNVNEEWTPGMFYDPQDFVDSVTADILHSLSAYKPTILRAEITTPKVDPQKG